MAGDEWKKLPKDIKGELVWKRGSTKWMDIVAQVFADTIYLYPKNKKDQIHLVKKISFTQISEISEVDRKLFKGFTIFLKNGEVEQFRCGSKVQGCQEVSFWVDNLRHARKFWEDKEIMKERATLGRPRKITLEEETEASKRLDPNTPRVFITLWNGEMTGLVVNNKSTFSDVYHRLFSSACRGTCRTCKLRHQFCKLWAVDTSGTKRAVGKDEILIDLSRQGDLLFVMEHNQKLLIVHFSDISYEILPAPAAITAEEVLKLDVIASKLNYLGCFNAGLFLKVESGAELLFEKNDKPFKYPHGKFLARSKAVRVNSKKKTKQEVISELRRAAHFDFYKREKISAALRDSLAGHIERSSNANDGELCFVFDHFALENDVTRRSTAGPKDMPSHPQKKKLSKSRGKRALCQTNDTTTPHDQLHLENNAAVIKTQDYNYDDCIAAWDDPQIVVPPQSSALDGFQPEEPRTPSYKEDWVQGGNDADITSSETLGKDYQSLTEETSSHYSPSDAQPLTEVSSLDQLLSETQPFTEVTSLHRLPGSQPDEAKDDELESGNDTREMTSSHELQSKSQEAQTKNDELERSEKDFAEVASSAHASRDLQAVTDQSQSIILFSHRDNKAKSIKCYPSESKSQLSDQESSHSYSNNKSSKSPEKPDTYRHFNPGKLSPGSAAPNDIPYGDPTSEEVTPSSSLTRSFSEPCAFHKQKMRERHKVSTQSSTGMSRQRFLSVSEPNLHHATCSTTLLQALTASEPDLNENDEDIKVRSVYYSEQSSEDSDGSVDFACPNSLPECANLNMTCSSGTAWSVARKVEKAVNRILAVKECSIEMNRVINDELCPALWSILDNGLKTNPLWSFFSKGVDAWSIIKIVSSSTKVAERIISEIKSSKPVSEKFRQFVCACVRRRYLGQWFELLSDDKVQAKISSYYEREAMVLDVENAKAMEHLKVFLDKLNFVELKKEKHSRFEPEDEFLYSFE